MEAEENGIRMAVLEPLVPQDAVLRVHRYQKNKYQFEIEPDISVFLNELYISSMD